MEVASRNLRALKLWHGLCPCLLPSILLSSAFTALSPYVTIWLSARLVDELAGLRRPQTLLTLALAELLSAALLALAAGALKRWKNAEMDASGQKEEELYMEKLFRLDYADLDDQATYKLYSRIRQSTQWSSWGMRRVRSLFEDSITALLRILGGVFLSVSLFASAVPGSSSLSWLNHPLFAALIPVLLLLTALLSPMCANRANAYWSRSDSDARFANRSFSFYGFMSMDRKRAADLRIYEQQENVCNEYLSHNNSFSADSSLAHWAKGPMGL